MIDFHSGGAAGTLDVQWNHGAPRKRRGAAETPSDPAIAVHAFEEHTLILRQNMTVSHEAPFMYLLFGNDRALLLDTGATADAALFPLRDTVDDLIEQWLARHPRTDYELLVAHSHSHSDHIAADAQFCDRPRTTVVGTEEEQVRTFFGLAESPSSVVDLDLGGRRLEVTPIPGHHPTSLALFDHWTGFLLTGDSVYPGRLYGADMPAYARSMDHLVDFAEARPVSHIMGCHIEMSTAPATDYPLGARYHPSERELQMTTAQLAAVREAIGAAVGKSGVHVHDDFIVASGMGPRTIAALLLRSLVARIRRRRV